MNIAVVTHNILKGDGQGRVNYELVQCLRENGVGVEMIADRVAPELEDMGATWIPVHPCTSDIDLVKGWHFRRLANEVIAKNATRYAATIACGAVLSIPHALNVAHFVHGTWLRSPFHPSRVKMGLNSSYQRAYSNFNAAWERTAFDRARHVVAVSEMVKKELEEIGVPGDKISVVINGVDLEEFSPGPYNRRELGLPEGVVLGLFAGDIRSSRKNLDSVLRALPDVANAHVAVAGSLARSPYPALAERLGVGDRVHFLGFRSDIASLMRASDFFVFPSRFDPCPLVLLEALASGLPIITTTSVGSSTLITSESGFVLSESDDLNGLRRAMQILTAETKTRKEMGRRARATAHEYSWNKMGERYLSIIENYVSGSDFSKKYVTPVVALSG